MSNNNSITRTKLSSIKKYEMPSKRLAKATAADGAVATLAACDYIDQH